MSDGINVQISSLNIQTIQGYEEQLAACEAKANQAIQDAIGACSAEIGQAIGSKLQGFSDEEFGELRKAIDIILQDLGSIKADYQKAGEELVAQINAINIDAVQQ